MYSKFFPEISNPPYNTEIRFLTLTDIGFRSSEKAAEAGYICVRHSYTSGYRAYHGLWITGSGLSTFKDMVQNQQEKEKP